MKAPLLGWFIGLAVSLLIGFTVYFNHKVDQAYEHMRNSLTEAGKMELICTQAVYARYMNNFDYYVDRNTRIIENFNLSYWDEVYNIKAFERIAKECL
jgi:hypothetical protein